MTEPCKPAIHLGPYVVGIHWRGIPEMLFDIAMTALLGVQIRCIGWQPFHLHLRVCSEVFLDDRSPVRIQSIPDDDHRPGDVPLEVAEGHEAIRRANGMLEMALVDLAGEREADHRGQLPALAHAPQDGWVADGRPRGGGLRAKREPGFVDEDNFRASATSLFLMRAQSCVSHAWTKASSRSRA